jgi:hypothetical protein
MIEANLLVYPSLQILNIFVGSFGPKAQTPEILYASSGHLPLNAKERGMVKAEKGHSLHDLGHDRRRAQL